jgi:tRNA(Ile)-lysidine synthase
MMKLPAIHTILKNLVPITKNDQYLVAISGGLDSVVLAYLCFKAELPITLAHCNFKLRGAESDRDELLVRQLGEQWGVKVLVKSFETARYAEQQQLSIQEAARNLRYTWFEELTNTQPLLKWILTAHHSDDNVETLLMNFFRGTGMAGLTGIPPRNGKILRPLLNYSREQLQQIALDNNLSYVNDSSNEKEDYTRNYFRLTILPALKKVYPSVTENLLNNIKRFTRIENLYGEAVKKIVNKILQSKGDEIHIPIGQLRRYQNTSLLFELLTPYGFSAGQVEEAFEFLEAQSGASIQAAHQNWRLIRHRNWLILAPAQKEECNYQEVLVDTKQLFFKEGELLLEDIADISSHIPTSSTHVWLDKKQIRFPLLFRKWREGDYFYPLGMAKKKKVARFLIDQRKSIVEKEKVWVLESAGKICWVVGERLDDRFKVTASTKSVLSIRVKEKKVS